MRISLRTLAFALVLSSTYGGFVIACPTWSSNLGLDVWNTFDGDEHDDLESEKRSAKELDLLNDRAMKRMEMKHGLVDELIDERIDLDHAAEQFHALNEIEPELTSHVRKHFPGNSDRERAANQVIAFVRTTLVDNPSQQVNVLNRLELQLREMKGQPSPKVAH